MDFIFLNVSISEHNGQLSEYQTLQFSSLVFSLKKKCGSNVSKVVKCLFRNFLKICFPKSLSISNTTIEGFILSGLDFFFYLENSKKEGKVVKIAMDL